MEAALKNLKKEPKEAKERKKRAPKANYSQDETDMLVQCALKEKKVLENKKTDSVASKDKISAWGRIADEYNSATNGMVRTASSLREKYAKIKSWLRLTQSSAAKDVKMTGGGPFMKEKALNEPLQELASLLSLSINGRNATVGDCDFNDETVEKIANSNVREINAENFCNEEEIFSVYFDPTPNSLDLNGMVPNSLKDRCGGCVEIEPSTVIESPIVIEGTAEHQASSIRDVISPNPGASHRWLKCTPSAMRGKTHPLLKTKSKRAFTTNGANSDQVAKKMKQEDEMHMIKLKKDTLQMELIEIERDHLKAKSKTDLQCAEVKLESARKRAAQAEIEYAELHDMRMKILRAELQMKAQSLRHGSPAVHESLSDYRSDSRSSSRSDNQSDSQSQDHFET